MSHVELDRTPDRSVLRAKYADRNVRISDFTLMALLPYRDLNVRGVPVNEMAMAVLVGLCLFRQARGGARVPLALVLAVGALLALLAYSALENDVEWIRRMGHMAIMAGLIWALGTGRASLRSSAIGLGCGLVSVAGLAMFKVGGDTYPGRLTGFLADPNAGAYFLVTLGILAIFFSSDSWKLRLVVAIPLVAAVVLTFSRTGLLAATFAVVWLLVGRRLGVASGGAFAVAAVVLVANIPEELQTFGPFSNRTGSDALRRRIIAQEYVVLGDMPWFGHGPGSAKVEVRGLEFFFHNSYLATRQEGGWGALGLVLLLLAIALVVLSPHARRGDMAAAAAQAALISVAAMSITVGEVLLDTPMAIAVGFALGHAVRRREPAQLDA